MTDFYVLFLSDESKDVCEGDKEISNHLDELFLEFLEFIKDEKTDIEIRKRVCQKFLNKFSNFFSNYQGNIDFDSKINSKVKELFDLIYSDERLFFNINDVLENKGLSKDYFYDVSMFYKVLSEKFDLQPIFNVKDFKNLSKEKKLNLFFMVFLILLNCLVKLIYLKKIFLV